MKNLKYIIIALVCIGLSSCMNNDWDTPQTTNAYGNNSITESNVVTIASLKTTYASAISATQNSYQLIEDNIQIKGRITGNDIEGNIFNNVAIEDGSGSILIGIAQGGLFGYLPVGQEIIVNLKGLYIGSYGQQAQIGTPYTNPRGATYVSRMNRFLWNDHFKLIGKADATSVTAEEFDVTRINDDASYLESNSGKLMTIKNVSFEGADGKKVFATESEKDAANSVNRALTGINSNQLVVRTSTYADFAALPLPTGRVNITGIFTRFRNTWQILIRQKSDIQTIQ